MWNVFFMFNIPYGIYISQTFIKKKLINFYILKNENGDEFISRSSS